MRATTIDHMTLPLPETFDFLLSARFVGSAYPPATCTISRRLRANDVGEHQKGRDNLESTLKRKIHTAGLKEARSRKSIVGLIDQWIARSHISVSVEAISHVDFKIRSIHAITMMPAHFVATFFIIILHTHTHTPRPSSFSVRVYVCACITSSPHSCRIGLEPALHPSQSRERCFRLLREKKVPRESRSDFNSVSKSGAGKQKVEEV